MILNLDDYRNKKLNDKFPSESRELSSESGFPLKIRKRSFTVMPGCSWDEFHQRSQALVIGLSHELPDWDFYFTSNNMATSIERKYENLWIISEPWFLQKFDELKQGIFYTTWPFSYSVLIQAALPWLDIVDHPSVHYGDKPGLLEEAITATHQADGMVTCISDKIKNELIPGRNADVWPNACWPRNFHLPSMSKDEPVMIGFWGSMGPWLDEPLLTTLSKIYPVRLATKNARDVAPSIGYLPYTRLKSFANICTHLIIPFQNDSNITKYSMPLKYYEYLYSNRWIIRPGSIEKIGDSDNEIVYNLSGADAAYQIQEMIESNGRELTSFNDLEKYSWNKVCRDIAHKYFEEVR